ncbi:MAG: hypothetical protein K0S01_1971 [Herbinix sp.]|jgi:hypothetical protein|nr:hypothetical protein [Herbinix sp.]
MIKKLELNVFNKFWVDCQIKNILTVLTTEYPDYIMLAALNNYSYMIGGRSGWYKSIYYYSKEFYDTIGRVVRKPYIFKTKDYINELKECIDNGRIISILVDLYYWPSQTLLFNEKHYYHHSMLIGYDDESQVMFFDDDVPEGKEYLVVSYDDIMKSIVPDNSDVFAIETFKPVDLEPFHYSMDDLVINAKKQMNHLISLGYSSHWSVFGKIEDIEIIITDVTKIYNRQKANSCFYEILYYDRKISDEVYYKLKEQSDYLTSEWRKLHSKMMKAYMKQNSEIVQQCNTKSAELLKAEYVMWAFFVSLNDIKRQEKLFVSNNIEPMTFSKVYEQEGFIRFFNRSDNEALRENSPIYIQRIISKLDTNNNYTTKIIIELEGCVGRLIYDKDKQPFKLFTYAKAYTDINYVNQMEIYEGKIFLTTNMPLYDIVGIENFILSYLPEADSELTDSIGNKLQPFDNLSLVDERIISEYANVYYTSPIIEKSSKISEICYPENISFSIKINDDYTCEVPEQFKIAKSKNLLVYYRYIIECQNNEHIKLHFRFNGGIKVWVNRKEIFTRNKKEKDFNIGEMIYEFISRSGENEIMIALESNNGYARGVAIQFEKLVDIKCNNKIEYYKLPFYKVV